MEGGTAARDTEPVSVLGVNRKFHRTTRADGLDADAHAGNRALTRVHRPSLDDRADVRRRQGHDVGTAPVPRVQSQVGVIGSRSCSRVLSVVSGKLCVPRHGGCERRDRVHRSIGEHGADCHARPLHLDRVTVCIVHEHAERLRLSDPARCEAGA